MTKNQIEYQKYLESGRHNLVTEEQGRRELDVRQREADIKQQEADTHYKGLLVSEKQAQAALAQAAAAGVQAQASKSQAATAALANILRGADYGSQASRRKAQTQNEKEIQKIRRTEMFVKAGTDAVMKGLDLGAKAGMMLAK
jgi:hypothetical protein